LTGGALVAFLIYGISVGQSMASLVFLYSAFQEAIGASKRVFQIVDTQPTVQDEPDAKVLVEAMGRVTFDRVSFSYESRQTVLKDIQLDVAPGEIIALVGPSGAGKSTMFNLIPRFYDPTSGSITIDGHDLRDVTIDSMRKQIGIVLQETNLFTGTIRDNIAFGRPDASEAEVIAAAKAAAAHDFIMEFPQGYETPVGERGTTLSGGQKQRIAIARALLLDPHILILDDSTSSVDLVTEYKIQQALDRLMKGRTSFVIAQRISTVLNADQILVLDKGTIAASGTHEELMEDSEIYAQIYQSQLVEDVHLSEAETVEAVEEMIL